MQDLKYAVMFFATTLYVMTWSGHQMDYGWKEGNSIFTLDIL
jgi:hypothetical protein